MPVLTVTPHAYHAYMLMRECRRCEQRMYALRRMYGMEVADYDAILAEQGGGCAICGATEGAGRRLHVDHDHRLNRVRGILCGQCNVAVGMFRDDPQRFSSAMAYIAREPYEFRTPPKRSVERICKVDGCGLKPAKKFMCLAHFDEWLRGQPRKPRLRCSEPGCDAVHSARGWCEQHFNNWRYRGHPQIHPPPRERDLLCSVEACVRHRHALGVCRMHYRRLGRTGDALAVRRGGPPSKLTRADLDRAAQLRESGLKQVDIASQLGVSPGTLSLHLARRARGAA